MADNMDNDIRRAFLKYIVLTVISKESTHGYEIIKTIETCSKGRWKPSTGSIYPILDYLVSEGFVMSEEIDRKKVYTITPEGSVALEEMARKKAVLLNEISMLIDNITEGDCE
jgi:DNA-binding PadR family transcriptional regulator